MAAEKAKECILSNSVNYLMFVKRNNRLLVYLALFILADTYIKY